jgi:protein-L-isoaspartate(D-aspartate) O-methyltransferase
VTGPEALVAGLRKAGIRDERVLSAMADVPRDQFVPATFADHAWDDVALPIGAGQTISQPYVVALMTAALQLTERDQILEIGTGSGYQTAILARLARRVFTIERHRPLLLEAEARFRTLRVLNVTTRFGDGSKGWQEPAPFDRILVTAASPQSPKVLLDLLAPGGILVAPLGHERELQRLVRIQRDADGTMYCEELAKVRFVPLVSGLPREKATA